MLCTFSVFSTTINWSPTRPVWVSGAIAAAASASRARRYPASVHARATARAPMCGPILVSCASTRRSSAAVSTWPAATSADSSARTRMSTSDSDPSAWSVVDMTER
jgi:hypothetical protein